MTRDLPPEVPRKRINAVIVNGRMVEVFEALCYIENRRPHQLVHDIVLAYCQDRETEPEVQAAIRNVRRYQSGLRVVGGETP